MFRTIRSSSGELMINLRLKSSTFPFKHHRVIHLTTESREPLACAINLYLKCNIEAIVTGCTKTRLISCGPKRQWEDPNNQYMNLNLERLLYHNKSMLRNKSKFCRLNWIDLILYCLY